MRAARRVVARYSANGATYTLIESEAGVAPGSIRYHFGTKERLLIEAQAMDAAERRARARERFAPATTRQEVLEAMAGLLGDFADEETAAHALLAAMSALALENEEIAAARVALWALWQETLTELLAERERAGVVALATDAATVARVLTALGLGLATAAGPDPAYLSEPVMREAQRYAASLVREPSGRGVQGGRS